MARLCRGMPAVDELPWQRKPRVLPAPPPLLPPEMWQSGGDHARRPDSAAQVLPPAAVLVGLRDHRGPLHCDLLRQSQTRIGGSPNPGADFFAGSTREQYRGPVGHLLALLLSLLWVWPWRSTGDDVFPLREAHTRVTVPCALDRASRLHRAELGGNPTPLCAVVEWHHWVLVRPWPYRPKSVGASRREHGVQQRLSECLVQTHRLDFELELHVCHDWLPFPYHPGERPGPEPAALPTRGHVVWGPLSSTRELVIPPLCGRPNSPPCQSPLIRTGVQRSGITPPAWRSCGLVGVPSIVSLHLDNRCRWCCSAWSCAVNTQAREARSVVHLAGLGLGCTVIMHDERAAAYV
mmetsp:Transcript_7887/g.22420  ORF Transcript_7887/g.22420 Transcript_7887/m.22420 type:complete len:350 (+) Transcript_7887:653-1702(+)